ncbi:hypothetical protein BN2537_3373 [Streptomyces venezuelae]|nr:hypothetical protein BN2537_3373 [Streptomyces venezuelae]
MLTLPSLIPTMRSAADFSRRPTVLHVNGMGRSMFKRT